MSTIKRVTLTAEKQYMVEDIPEPHAGPGEVRMQVAYDGICGSDIHIWLQHHPTCSGRFPLPMGHEFSGVIDEIGEGVVGFNIGDPCSVQPVRGCGKCKWCTDPDSNLALCPEERFYDGGTAEYYVAAATNVVTFKNNKDLKDIAFNEPLAVAVHGLKLIPKGVKGKNVLVTGAGAIGLLTAQAAKYMGAEKVFVTDLMENRLEIVKELGLIPINPVKDNFEEIFEREIGSKQIEICCECAGSEKSLANCIEYVEPKGAVVLLAVFAKNPVVDMFRVEDREIRIYGAYQYTPEDFFDAAEIIENKGINCHILGQVEYDFLDTQEAMEFTANNPDKCLKTMLKIHPVSKE